MIVVTKLWVSVPEQHRRGEPVQHWAEGSSETTREKILPGLWQLDRQRHSESLQNRLGLWAAPGSDL